MMRLLIFGATGATGRQLVKQALDSAHQVTAFVRDTSRLATQSEQLRSVTGDVMNAAAVDAAIPGHDAVLVALGTMPEDPQDRSRRQPSEPVCSVGAAHITASMLRHGVRRVVIESSLAIGSSRSNSRLGAASVVRWALKDVMQDKERQETIVRNSNLDWTIIRPARLTNGRRSLHVQSGESLSWSLLSTVSRADVAALMLKSLGDDSTIRKALSLIG
jgi:uncharacterized protein YbjT (DUF2867 family)